MILDQYESKHLNNWIENYFNDEDKENALTAIFKCLEDDPELIENGYSWPEILNKAINNGYFSYIV